MAAEICRRLDGEVTLPTTRLSGLWGDKEIKGLKLKPKCGIAHKGCQSNGQNNNCRCQKWEILRRRSKLSKASALFSPSPSPRPQGGAWVGGRPRPFGALPTDRVRVRARLPFSSVLCTIAARGHAARVPKSTLVLSPERASENHFFLSTNQDQDARVGGGAWRTDARHDCSGRGRMPPALESVLSGW